MEIGNHQLKVMLRHVVPIEQYAIRIAEAHRLGHGPGDLIEPWSMEIQRQAAKIWTETLPAPFLSQVAESYRRCAEFMGNVTPNGSAAGDWGAIQKYLGAVATAIGENPECAASHDSSDLLSTGGMPEVIRYDKLAAIMHPDSVEKLRAAAAAVALTCRSRSQNAPDEMQLACLQGLANGEKHADLAKRLGYSQRHFQRILADMWHQFEVENTIQGVSHAVAQGWITVSGITAQERTTI